MHARGFPGDRDGVGILKAKGRKPPYAPTIRRFTGNAGVHGARVAGQGVGERILQHGNEPGARILRIDIDRVGAKGCEGHFGGAEPRATRDGDSARLEQLGEDFREQIRFAERLRGDDDREGGGGSALRLGWSRRGGEVPDDAECDEAVADAGAHQTACNRAGAAMARAKRWAT